MIAESSTPAAPMSGGRNNLHPDRLSDPDPRLLDGLGEDGVNFIEAVFAERQLTTSEGFLVRLSAQALDDASSARTAGDLKGQRASVRQFLACLHRLGLPVPDRWS